MRPLREQVKEQVRAGPTGVWRNAFGQDVRSAWRSVRHAPGYAVWVVGSLAIGMAVMIAALALLNALLVRSFPGLTDQEQLVRVSVSRNCGRPDCWSRMSSPADYEALRTGMRALEDLAAYTQGELAVGVPARSMRGLLTSANYFDVLGVQALVGRTFGPGDAAEHAAVAVLSHAAWTTHFAADRSIAGRSVRVAGEIVQVVGVAPPFFLGIDRSVRPGARDPDMWLPLWLADRVLPSAGETRQARDVSFVGRLRADADVRQAQAEAAVLASGLAAHRDPELSGARAEVRPVSMIRPEQRRLLVMLVLPIPVLVLVIACVNAANLMLARGSQRGREIAIRLAIGAGRARIVRQLLIESLLLAGTAAALALPLAWWGLELAGGPTALRLRMPIDSTVVFLAVLTAAGTAVAFGLAPAVRASVQQPASVLGPAAGGGATPRQSFTRRALVVSQVALSIGLLATGWQLVATMRAAGGSAGAPPDRLLIARFSLEPLGFRASEADTFYGRLLEGAARLPGVERAGLSPHTAVWSFGQGAGSASVVVWHPDDGPADGRVYVGGYAGGDLFEAVGLRVLHGRAFAEGERYGRPRVAVVNEAFADKLDRPAVGQVLRVARRDQDVTSAVDVQVVGIIESAREPRHTDDGRPVPKIYLPSPLGPAPALALYVRSRTMAAAVAQPVRDLVSQLDARVPVLETGSLEEMNERSFGPQLWLARAAAVLGGIGLLLATTGLYGMASYVVSMRVREFAIRMAIGARPGRVLAMVLGQSMRLAAVGLGIGGLAAFIVSRVIQAEYHGIHGMDVTAVGGSAALFVVAMLVASGIPAIRASRVDPIASLKDG